LLNIKPGGKYSNHWALNGYGHSHYSNHYEGMIVRRDPTMADIIVTVFRDVMPCSLSALPLHHSSTMKLETAGSSE